LAQLIRGTIDVTDHIWAEPDGQTPRAAKRPSPKSTSKRQRPLTQAARRRQRAERSRGQGRNVDAAS
jgi:hypothetical protein